METETKTVGPQVGDILVSSWGYDQTNVDFWWVFSLTPSGKSVRIRPVAQRVVERFTGGERVVPVDPDEDRRTTDEATTSLVRWYEFRGERQWCVGVPVGYKTTADLWGGEPVYQTAAGWGH